jgi:hypothetical protein
MKMTIEIDCTPVEARAFLGLPDVSGLNEHLVKEMQNRMDANGDAGAGRTVEELDGVRRRGAGTVPELMTAAAGTAARQTRLRP